MDTGRGRAGNRPWEIYRWLQLISAKAMSYYSSSRLSTYQLSKLTLDAKLQHLESHAYKSGRQTGMADVLSYVIKNQNESDQHYLLSTLLERFSLKSSGDLRYALGTIDRQLQYCKNFSVFILVVRYIIVWEAPASISCLETSFNVFARKYNFYQEEVRSMQNQDLTAEHGKVVEAIRMGVEILPQFYQKLKREIDFSYLSSLLGWVLVCPASNVDDCKALGRYCRFLAQQCIGKHASGNQYDCSGARQLLRLVFEKSLRGYEGAQNLCFVLESMNDMMISQAIASRLQDFVELPPQSYVHSFSTLIRASMGPMTLKYMTCITNALRVQYEFNVLKLIYEEFILKKLARFYKFTTTAQSEIQNLVSTYVFGFMNKVQVSPDLVKYLLTDFRLLPKKHMNFWLELAVVIAYKRPDVQREIMPIVKEITSLNSIQQLCSQIAYQTRENQAWVFMDKDIKDKKRYKLSSSYKVGILNESTNCYLITAIQGLFMSRTLPDLLKFYESTFARRYSVSEDSRCPLLYNLNLLFDNLKNESKNCNIDRLKQVGPESFRNPAQQDSQHYITELFDSISKEIELITDQKLKRQFQVRLKNSFQIGIQNQIVCEKCKNKSGSTEQCYILSIDYKETLSQEWESQVQGWTCDKCKFQGTEKQKFRIIRFPEVVLVHIKRFHYQKEVGEVKRLDEANIERKFKNYQLEGFISHIGSKVVFGHYMLYYRSPNDPLKWILFNDKRVNEFRIENEEQKFELNFKSENTPYIVIYKKKSRETR